MFGAALIALLLTTNTTTSDYETKIVVATTGNVSSDCNLGLTWYNGNRDVTTSCEVSGSGSKELTCEFDDRDDLGGVNDNGSWFQIEVLNPSTCEAAGGLKIEKVKAWRGKASGSNSLRYREFWKFIFKHKKKTEEAAKACLEQFASPRNNDKRFDDVVLAKKRNGEILTKFRFETKFRDARGFWSTNGDNVDTNLVLSCETTAASD